MNQPAPRRVVVVGGGIAGLTAAHDLAATGAEVLVLEGSPRTGGKLRRAPVAGVTVDVGAEAMLNRRPEGVALARALDLPVEHPTAASSRVWTRGALRPLPRSLMGVPLDLDQLADSGVLSSEGLARVRAERDLPPTPVDGDVSVGDLVAARLGDEVVDRLVEPLLGGVYAGRARELSARATVPQLVALLERGPLLDASVPASDVPVFAGLRGGMAGLADALVAAGAFEVRTGATVRELRRSTGADGGSRFALTIGSAAHPELVEADAVVLATPAAPTARLLAGLAPVAAAELAALEYASMAVVTLAFRAAELTSAGSIDARRTARASSCRRSTAGGSRPRRSRSPSGPGSATPGGARWTGRTCCCCAPRWAGTGRRAPCRPPTTSSSRPPWPTSRPPPGSPRRRSTPTCSAGAAGCRSTPSVTSTGWPGSVPTSPGSPGWRSAERRTTGSGSRRSSPRPTVP